MAAEQAPGSEEGAGATDAARWDARYADGDVPLAPATTVVDHAADLAPGRALDVAGGAGRHALWLAGRGWQVTLVDVSAVGIELARRRAQEAGVAITTVVRDLAAAPLPSGPFDLVVVVAFLDRTVLAQVPRVLAPGGRLLFVHPTVANLERHGRPPGRFLLDPGEISTIADRLDLAVEVCEERWSGDGHHEACLLARRPA